VVGLSRPSTSYSSSGNCLPPPVSSTSEEASFEVEITGVSEFWLPIVLNTLSEQAYALKLKSKLICDFEAPTTVHFTCDGRETACEAFKEHLNALVGYIHSRRM
jgi:hypothetical protein